MIVGLVASMQCQRNYRELYTNAEIQKMYQRYGELNYVSLKSSMFPYRTRQQGYVYKGVSYPRYYHYQTNTAAVFIPKEFSKKKKTDLVVFFHGWYTTINNFIVRHDIIPQFAASNKNAILIVPAGPRLAPDSYGGKFENKNGFTAFIREMAVKLRKDSIISSGEIGTINLAGFSGGYRVIAKILQNGDLSSLIKEVYLFDGVYGAVESYAGFCRKKGKRCVLLYCEKTPTEKYSLMLYNKLKLYNVDVARQKLDTGGRLDFSSEKLILYADIDHYKVVLYRQLFYKILSTSSLVNIYVY